MNIKVLLMAGLAAAIVFFACKEDKLDDVTDMATVEIRLTDDPCDCQEVNIDIREIQLKTADDTSQWISINTISGIYDLLLLQDDVDILIATGQVAPVELKEVRFVLGDQNTVMVDDVLYPLQTPSAQSSGLKVKIDKNLDQSTNTFLLDFDAAESVKEQNGKYTLHPVIKLK